MLVTSGARHKKIGVDSWHQLQVQIIEQGFCFRGFNAFILVKKCFTYVLYQSNRLEIGSYKQAMNASSLKLAVPCRISNTVNNFTCLLS